MSGDLERRFDTVSISRSARRDGLDRRLDRGLHDGEFVTAEPRNRVGLPQAIEQAFGDGLQQAVADGMPERVVHRLELIEIETMERQQLTPARICEGLFELLVEQHAIGQVGQCIMMGEMSISLASRRPLTMFSLKTSTALAMAPISSRRCRSGISTSTEPSASAAMVA